MMKENEQGPADERQPHAHHGALRLPYALGRYTLFDFIGRGGMAQIYLARTNSDLGASRLCVLKLILSEYAGHAQFADMLTYEAKLAAQLGHANIVHVFELGRIDGRLFIAMEYIEGFDLNALLRRCSRQKVPLPMEFALYIVICVLRGLDYAHRRADDMGRPLGIVHRDVSPSNLLISFEGEVKVCDFGIAHANDVVAPLATEMPVVDEAIKGKAGYMSPEHARGAILDARADVFAAGIVLWELLAGRRLYRPAGPQTRASLLEQARKAEIPPLPKRALPREADLHAIVACALAVDKNSRYPSAAAMLRDLEAYAIDTGRMPNPLKLGIWLSTHFGGEVIAHRRMRERSAASLNRAVDTREARDEIQTPLPPPPSGPPVSSFPVTRSLPPLPSAPPLETITVPALPSLSTAAKISSIPAPPPQDTAARVTLPSPSGASGAAPPESDDAVTRVAPRVVPASDAPAPATSPDLTAPDPASAPDLAALGFDAPGVVAPDPDTGPDPITTATPQAGADLSFEDVIAPAVVAEPAESSRGRTILLLFLIVVLAVVAVIVLRGGLLDSL